jgi:iron(III) transport system permease protein
LIKLGLINPQNPIDWFGEGGFWGIVILQVLSLYPILFLNLSAAMANIDPALVEAAKNLGASGWRLFRTVTLPLILPGYFAGAIIVFIWAFTDLGTPLIFGYSRVVPVQIFDSVTQIHTNPMGHSLVVLVLLLTVILFWITKKLLASRRYEMLARGLPLVWKQKHSFSTLFIWVGISSLIIIALLPHLMVILQSFSEKWFFSILPNDWSSKFYSEILRAGPARASISNSLFYSSISAFVDLLLGVTIAWLLTRQKIPGAALLDSIAMLPLAVPGIVIAFGYMAGFDVKISWLNPREIPVILLIISYSIRPTTLRCSLCIRRFSTNKHYIRRSLCKSWRLAI